MGAGREFEGRDLEDALSAASNVLGIPAEQIHYELLTEGRRGVFGLGARRVKIWVDLSDATEGDSDDRAVLETAWAEDRLREILRLMQLDIALHAEATFEGPRIEIDGADRGLLLARDAELLEALQLVLNRMARKARPDAGRIRIECRDHRRRRDGEIVDLARDIARQVQTTGAPRLLRPMNPYERRLVHMTVQEYADLESWSEGSGFLKRVRVGLAEPRGRA
jgi:spoIIIJ-associated protein